MAIEHRQTKGAETDRWIPNGGWKPVLYSTFRVPAAGLALLVVKFIFIDIYSAGIAKKTISTRIEPMKEK